MTQTSAVRSALTVLGVVGIALLSADVKTLRQRSKIAAMFQERGLTGARLTATILRVETAAVAAAAIAAVILADTSP